MLEEKDIEKYKTIEVNKDLRNYQYLKNVAKNGLFCLINNFVFSQFNDW